MDPPLYGDNSKGWRRTTEILHLGSVGSFIVVLTRVGWRLQLHPRSAHYYCNLDNRKEVAWIGQNNLKITYHALYSICLRGNPSINQMWNKWDSNFRRALNDWEIENVAAMLELLESFSGISERSESLRWKWNSTGIFQSNLHIGTWTREAQLSKLDLEEILEHNNP